MSVGAWKLHASSRPSDLLTGDLSTIKSVRIMRGQPLEGEANARRHLVRALQHLQGVEHLDSGITRSVSATPLHSGSVNPASPRGKYALSAAQKDVTDQISGPVRYDSNASSSSISLTMYKLTPLVAPRYNHLLKI